MALLMPARMSPTKPFSKREAMLKARATMSETGRESVIISTSSPTIVAPSASDTLTNLNVRLSARWTTAALLTQPIRRRLTYCWKKPNH